MPHLIIGVDCATTARRVGLARAVRDGSRFRVDQAITCTDGRSPAEIVAQWIGPDRRALIALDAPLGWPADLGPALATHTAGDPVTVPANLLFRRATDRAIAERTGKTPLDVGADRIARTAHWSLRFLGELRHALGEPIPLAWHAPLVRRVMAIEVYPAATLLMHGAALRGYKKPEAVRERNAILDLLGRRVDCNVIAAGEPIGVDALDAVACVVAAVDFLSGEAEAPEDVELAGREGWIWVRRDRLPTAT